MGDCQPAARDCQLGIANQLLGLFKLLFPYLFSKLGIERVCKEEGNVKKGRKKPDMIFLYRVLKIFFEKYHNFRRKKIIFFMFFEKYHDIFYIF